MVVREELDLKLLECGVFKLVKEKDLFDTQDKLDEISMEMGLAESVMNACNAEIKKQNDFVDERSIHLKEVTDECNAIHKVLAAELAIAEEDVRVITLILD